jgi:hypothetical protein
MSLRPSRERALDAERHRRASLLPPNTACEACGEDDLLLLDADVSMVLCADDAAISRREELAQRHHIADHRWPIVLDLTPNWHRVVTALQHLQRGITHGKIAELLYGIAHLIIAIADYLDQLEKKSAQRG